MSVEPSGDPAPVEPNVTRPLLSATQGGTVLRSQFFMGLGVGWVLIGIIAVFSYLSVSRHQAALSPTIALAPNTAPVAPLVAAGPAVDHGVPAANNGAAESAPQETTYVLTEANTKDIWSTSVYSYAPGGGGPGGGLANDYLRVGGSGDEYVSLIKFDLPAGPCARRAVLQLFNMPDGVGPTPMRLYVITQTWSWVPGDRLWWRDLPSVADSPNGDIPAPPINGWQSIDISAIYGKWCRGEISNDGIMLRPVETNNTYNHFASTRSGGGNDRLPRLLLSSG